MRVVGCRRPLNEKCVEAGLEGIDWDCLHWCPHLVAARLYSGCVLSVVISFCMCMLPVAVQQYRIMD